MTIEKIAAIVIAVIVGGGTPAYAQSNTGVTNAAPNPRTSVPTSTQGIKTDTSPDGVTNGAPHASNVPPTPKPKAKVKSAEKRAFKSAPAGVEHGAPNTLPKIYKIHKVPKAIHT
jgi:hypothetical protein